MIPIVEAEEVISGRQRGGQEKYAVAIERLLDWIKDSIESSNDGSIRMKIKDLAREMGPDFVNRTPMVVYRNLKPILLEKNIITEIGTHKDGDKLIIMRYETKLRGGMEEESGKGEEETEETMEETEIKI